MQAYETFFILDSNKYVRDPNGLSMSLATMVEKLGGEVLLSRLWNEQKLAYPIDGHKKGTYWLMYARIESTKLPEWNRAIQLNEGVLRHLSIKIDPKLIDHLVANAKGGKAKPARTDVVGAVAGAPVEGIEVVEGLDN